MSLPDEDRAEIASAVDRLFAANRDTPALLRARSLAHDRIVVLQIRIMRPDNKPPFAVAVTSELGWPDGFDEFLRSVFSLSESEAEVLRALTECLSVNQIAEARGRSVQTVRAQVKALLAKTETKSQAELVHLTLSTMDIANFTHQAATDAAEISAGTNTLEPRPFHSLTLPDGRRMEYLILGDADGGATGNRTCVFLPQDYGLTRWPASAEAAAAKQGIRVIVPVRPGYGRSSPLPKGKTRAQAVSHDLALLLDHLGVSACPFVSLGADSYFTAHFNTRYPGRVSAMIACAGVLPLTRTEQYERMHKWHRFILSGARYTPHLLPFMVKAGFALARKLGKRGFLQAVYGNSAADVATFEDPQVFEALAVGSNVALSPTHSAHAAFSAEVIEQERSDWRAPVDRMRDQVPVHFVNGLQDPQMPAATLREMEEDYPWINFHIHADSGQLIFFKKWPQVLDLIEKHL